MAGTPIFYNSTNQLSLFSYNSTGWNAHKAKMINDFLILKSIKIVALQEHFLLKQNLHKIQEHFLNYELFALPEPVFTDVNLADKLIYPLNWLI